MKKFILIYVLMSHFIFSGTENYNVTPAKEKNSDKTMLETLKLRGNWTRLKNQTITAGILAVGTFGILYSLPEESTGWNRVDDFWEERRNNLKNGPQWDHDASFFNFVAHPYVGSTYYIAARKSEFNRFDSFLYSAAMSTFLWEFGIETFSEVPSIQDLIITPILGSALGEVLYFQGQKIVKNDRKIFGSKFLGETTLIVIDPIGTLSNLIGFKDDEITSNWNLILDKDNGNPNGISLSISGSL